MNSKNLIRWSGLAAVVAGIFYIIVGLFHPVESLSAVTTARWAIVHALATAMSFFGVIGITGLYARQVKEVGWLGLAGYLLLSLWLMLIAPFTFAEVLILPMLTTESPKFVESFLGIFNGHPGAISLGVLAMLYALSGIVYILGGLLFGIAAFRAGILPRWATALLAAGTALSPAASLLPHEYEAFVAVPVGVAFIGLGYALWSERYRPAANSGTDRPNSRMHPTPAK